ncbi:hypothetical protein BBJ29_005938 [Phytophthora kernoviae]|uniref:Uncharacterized protein n=1 Tax=Phytophthora kernoviae TaxID=325452 RepID=A0A3F2RXS1_9STRA|nr:hypothetical protein BBJ29_005938 [Phytophthora kernoviae]RLN66321.1 hypothetical protein BBP00_00002299 [Phytophthora kernoviae]
MGSETAFVPAETPNTFNEAPPGETNRLDLAFDKVENPEQTASKDKETPKGQLVSMSELFSYADGVDKTLMVLGTIGALAAGISQPIQIVLFGDVLNTFNPSDPGSNIEDAIGGVALNFVYVGIAVLIAGSFQVACWTITASRQAKRIRSEYVSAIMTKEIGWFDVNEPMQLGSRVAEATVTIQEGMGRKVGDGLNFFSMAVSGLTIGLIKGWQLALILLAFTPFIAVTAFLAMKVLSTATQAGLESYGKAGAVAQEALSNVRTVHMFNSIEHFVKKYENALSMSTTAGIKKGFAVGWGTGLMFGTVFCTYAGGMFFGALMVANDNLDGNHCTGYGCYDGGRVLTVFFAVIMGAMALGQAAPSAEAITSARAAAYPVFQTIKRPSLIDPLNEEGKTLEKVTGKIQIDGVSFAYPSRPEVKVCSNYSLTIEAGETVALVGPSGSGKSTIVSLLERFYDPLSGTVSLDGADVRTLNVKWLRSQVGLVGQEPSLFATSIMENIRYGCPSATDEQVIEAARMANAYNFIKEFPQGFKTEVGERGAQLSGGQKQRIAIARAIIKNPPILLLDEATSALDTESERIVQASLDQLLANSHRTTVIIAHRLSTIRNANRIAVHSGGSIVEIGSHDELMQLPNGHYRLLVDAQNRTTSVEEEGSSTEVTQIEHIDSQHERARSARSSRLSFSRHSMSEKEAAADGDGAELGDVDLPPISMARIWKMSLPEWKFLIMGAFGAIVNAAVFPVWGVLLVKITVLFFRLDYTKHEMLWHARWWSLGFVGLGILFALSMTMQHYGFAVVSQRLVSRIRLATFSAMLYQEIGWFDLDENSSGALVSRLATDSAVLQAMTSETLNRGLVNITTLTVAFAIAFFYSWQMTLILLAAFPILVLSSFIQAQQMSGTSGNKKNNDADTAAGSLLSEAIGSIRTVASFSMEKALNSMYVGYLSVSKEADVKMGVVGGAAFGISQGAMFLVLAFLFYISGRWISRGIITFEEMFMVLMVIMLSTFAMGMAAQGATDGAKAKRSAQRVFKVIDRKPLIDATSSSGRSLPRVDGDIEFRNLQFAYPARPDAKIYKNYSLKIARGQTVALVGASGSGKSTAISLLERFYDPASGAVTLDGADLKDLNLQWLRQNVSLVSQEPVLFAGTIAENIDLGKPGSTREEIMEAAKKANAYDFITNFPNGFDTDVGDRGAQVSGGQKQRIAIARAILSDPAVLLLDEATSALDNESERVVQASLDRLLALKQRTTIIVAHRLSTIRNANLIAVTHGGAIVEQGTHDQLMQIPNGIYKGLVARQRAGVDDLLQKLQQPKTAKNLYVMSTRSITDADICRLASTISTNTLLEELYLSGHRLGPDGLQAFAECLAINTTLKHLGLGNDSLGDAAVQTLCAGLRCNVQSALQVWDLEYKSLGVDGSSAIADLLAVNTSLKTLALSRNQVGDQGVEKLAAGLIANEKAGLHELQLTDAGITGAGLDKLAPLLVNVNCSLETLQLSFNALGSATSAFFDALATNSSLKKLQLKECKLTDAHAAALAAALKQNKALVEIDVTDNELTQAACASLAEGLRENKTLKIMRLSNNKCQDEGALLLADVLKTHNSSLTYLELNNNSLTVAGMTPLLSAQSLKELHLFNNGLGEGLRELLPALLANSVIETFGVGANQLHGELCVMLFDALHSHPSLKTLEMGGNSLGEEGHKALDKLKEANRLLDVAVDKSAQDEDGNFNFQNQQ